MKVWPVRELSAQRTAPEEDYVSLRNSSDNVPTLLGLLTLPFGMLTNMLDACATWDSEDLTAPFKSAHLVLMFFWEVETTREETAPEEESATTRKVSASASLDTMEPDANSKPSLVKQGWDTFFWIVVWIVVNPTDLKKLKGLKIRKIVWYFWGGGGEDGN